jgi:hypothetical protein
MFSIDPGKPARLCNTLASHTGANGVNMAKREAGSMYTMVVVILALASLAGALGLLREALRETS